MSKQTEGPWSVERATVYALHGEPPRNRFSALVQSGRRDDAGEDEREANARLMAAAPDLLAAAKRALTVLKAQGESVRRGNVLDALETAIARATEGGR